MRRVHVHVGLILIHDGVIAAKKGGRWPTGRCASESCGLSNAWTLKAGVMQDTDPKFVV